MFPGLDMLLEGFETGEMRWWYRTEIIMLRVWETHVHVCVCCMVCYAYIVIVYWLWWSEAFNFSPKPMLP